MEAELPFRTNVPRGCPRCDELMDLASIATVRHMRALTRLQVAQLRNDGDQINIFQIVVSATCRARMKAEAAYREHLQTHGTAASAGRA